MGFLSSIGSKISSALNRIIESPTSLIGKAADVVANPKQAIKNLPFGRGTANISGAFVSPTPVPGPVVGVPGGTYQGGQAVITPEGSFNVPGGTTQYYFPEPVPTAGTKVLGPEPPPKPIGPEPAPKDYVPWTPTVGGTTGGKITYFNPFTTRVSGTGELLTGLGGFGPNIQIRNLEHGMDL